MDQHQRFQEILAAHKGILIKVSCIYCRNEADRSDLIQEISIQIWKSLNKFNDKYKLSTWIYRIALNVAISYYRKNSQRINATIPLEQVHEGSNDPAASDEEHKIKLLNQFINELNELDKALMLLYLEEKSHAEIAAIFGMSVSNVGTRTGRIKEKLKNKFLMHKINYYE